MSIRQQLVNCLEFMEGIEAIYEEIVQRQEHIAGMQSEENRREDRLSLIRSICLIAGIFSVLFIVLFVAVGVVQFSKTIASNGLNDALQQLQIIASEAVTDPEAIKMIMGVLIMLLLIIAAIIGSPILWIRSAKKLRRLKVDNQRKRQELEAEIQELQERMRSKLEEGSDKGYYRIVPADYFSSDMLRYCISVIDRKLATTLQEVFLLLEQELQRQEQLEHSQMLYDAQAERLDRLTDAVNVNTIVTMLAQQERYR